MMENVALIAVVLLTGVFVVPASAEESLEDRVRRLDAESAPAASTDNSGNSAPLTIWGRPSIEYGPEGTAEAGSSSYRYPKDRARDALAADLVECSKGSTGGYLDKKACTHDAVENYRDRVETLKRQHLDVEGVPQDLQHLPQSSQ